MQSWVSPSRRNLPGVAASPSTPNSGMRTAVPERMICLDAYCEYTVPISSRSSLSVTPALENS